MGELDLSALPEPERALFRRLRSGPSKGITARDLASKMNESTTRVVALLCRLYDRRLVEGTFCEETFKVLWRPAQRFQHGAATGIPKNGERTS